MHQLAKVENGFAVGKDGTRERLRFTLPVSSDSKSVKLPAAIAGGDSARDQLRREKLKPYIEGLLAHLGDKEMSLQDCGNFLGSLPGWRQAVTELRMNNSGLRAILSLFPELRVGERVSRA